MNTLAPEPSRFANATEEARFNMVEQQVRTWEVLDQNVLDLMSRVPREGFVPAQYQGLAFADIEIPLGFGQTMLSPKIEGRILQALALEKHEHVLEIGSGSGYLSALLGHMSKSVVSLDIQATFTAQAKQRTAAHNVHNITFFTGDASRGWADNAPYDAIVYTGSLPLTPANDVKQMLKIGGRMFVVVGAEPVMQAKLITRIAEQSYREDVIFETCLPELNHAPQAQQFTF